MRGGNRSVETVNAAASAIAAAESRVQQTTVQKRRWSSCWSLYWCFGSHRHDKRFSHSVLVPEPTVPGSAAPATQNPMHPPTGVLPFVAPPSSPASFFQSEPPSATQSPSGLLSFNAVSANNYSPNGPASIFAIGPYAHETQLVSPPVFSTFTTEPSTAPLTPPEPVQLTTPSSPEVPFAQLLISSLDPNHKKSGMCQKFTISNYEFQSYQLYPGSPIGQLISPSSAISGSGTSSPYPDREFIGGRPFLHIGAGEPPKILSIDRLSSRYWRPGQGSGSLTPDAAVPTSQDSFILEGQVSEVASLANSENESQKDDVVIVINHRVSFELTAEDVEVAEVASCVEKVPLTLIESAAETLPDTTAEAPTTQRDGILSGGSAFDCRVGETLNDMPEGASGDAEEEQQEKQQHPSLMQGSAKEFKFDNADGGTSDKPTIGSEWWANEKVVGKESGSCTKWAFFPLMQPGVS
ncbi:uncharacterized protein LOC122059506 [Macadamia integrifolia]|uniref:uncharacterized protein LOC122059506 n=1 Tax=Macadamia integrifolia TaxID=60698 RepID=UPI001C52E862|nr:uncharacterized protein LOC122059506 [Macadamia integrifolia]